MNIVSHFRAFAHNHDEIPAFHAGYLVLTLLAAALFNVGVFGALIVVHMGLDIVKYREAHGLGWGLTLRGLFRESLFDIGLLCIALVFATYLHHTSSAVDALSGLMRAEVTILRAIGTLVPKMQILQHVLAVVLCLRSYMEQLHPHLRDAWTTAEKSAMVMILLCLILLMLGPTLLGMEPVQYQRILFDELIPRLT